MTGYRSSYNYRASVAFSRTGRYLLSAGGKVKLWEVATGKEVKQLGDKATRANWAAFLAGDRKVLYADSPEPAHVVDLRSGGTGKAVRWDEGIDSGRGALSPDGKCALFFRGELLVLWDLLAGEEIRTLRGPISTKPPVVAVAFSKDGKKAISVSDGTVVVWGTSNWKVVKALRDDDGSRIYDAVLSADGKQALTGGDEELKLWDLVKGEVIWVSQRHKNVVNCVAFSRDESRAMSGDCDGIVILWDMATRREIRTFRDKTGGIGATAFFPNGRQALVCGGRVLLWDFITGSTTELSDDNRVARIGLSPDGKSAVLAGDSLQYWDIISKKLIHTKSPDRRRGVKYGAVAIAPNGKYALAGGGAGRVELCEMQTGKLIRPLLLKGIPRDIRALAFSPDGKCALAGMGGQTLKLLDVNAGKEIRTLVTNYDLRKDRDIRRR
jgi:WD40 repeat protein